MCRAIRQAVGDDNMINEALEEHHVVSVLARELRAMQANDERYTAKFKVLSDIVLRHIQQKEAHIPQRRNHKLIGSTLEKRPLPCVMNWREESKRAALGQSHKASSVVDPLEE